MTGLFSRAAAPRIGALLPVAVLVAGACGGPPPPPPEPPEPPTLALFVYDRSTSIPDHSLELAHQLTRGRILELDHGDRIAGMELLQLSIEEPPQRWSDAIPEREVPDFEVRSDSVARARFLADADILLSRLASTENRQAIDGTDILSTLHDVAEEIRAYPDHEAILYLFSDMLQSNRQIDMEGLRRMPPDGWLEEAAANGTLPDLGGLCVVVVGARVDTPAAQRVKAFWQAYFDRTGARLDEENYMLRPVRLPESPCG